ncbi:hypothetical protein BH20ACI2_BH20ACI2_04930 [soil metagenome]
MKSTYKLRLVLLIFWVSLTACTFKTANTDPAANSTANVELSVPAAAGGGEVQIAMAEAIVAEVYKQHDAKKSPFFQTKDRALVDRYFTKQLADLIWKDAVSSDGEIGALDADPLYDAQDIEIKNLKIGAAEVKGDKATVTVTFSNYREKKTLKFSLLLVNEAWKIADINYGRKETLVTWLKSGAPETAGDQLGEFEGKYLVGETTCTVEFKNKGFAVQWAKGSGVEYFSFMEGTTFASSTVESEANKFVFDDENYNTGTFYRPDGRTFDVRRAR